jgi:hypothetical protein
VDVHVGVWTGVSYACVSLSASICIYLCMCGYVCVSRSQRTHSLSHKFAHAHPLTPFLNWLALPTHSLSQHSHMNASLERSLSFCLSLYLPLSTFQYHSFAHIPWSDSPSRRETESSKSELLSRPVEFPETGPFHFARALETFPQVNPHSVISSIYPYRMFHRNDPTRIEVCVGAAFLLSNSLDLVNLLRTLSLSLSMR